MSVTDALPRPTDKPASNSFRSVLWSEWTKFRTVRGWIVALVLAAAATFFLCYETAAGPHTGDCSGLPAGAVCTSAPRTVVPTGPGGEAVADTYEFVHRTLTCDGSVTAEITSLVGATATNSSNVQGSPSASHPGLAYAAVMATGSHGTHFQYTHDTSDAAGTVTASTPRWLRLIRSGDTITGFASTNGQRWTEVGSADLPGLPATVQVGLFTTSPLTFQGGTGYPTLATATFDHLNVDGSPASKSCFGQDIGTGRSSFYPTLTSGSYHQSGTAVVVSGSGDVAPAVVQGLTGTRTASSSLLLGLIVGLLVVIVVAARIHRLQRSACRIPGGKSRLGCGGGDAADGKTRGIGRRWW